jgi:competence ComEA-like helix-hairpin-helix protein
MFTRDERRALLFLFGTAALGAGVKAVRAGADGPPGAPLIAPGLAQGNLAAQESSTARALASARPLEPGERVDLDRADALEIERLPRIGPQLARRIVDERTSGGPFHSLEGLGRVRGVGPAILEGLERQAMFSGVPAAPLVAAGAGDSLGPQDPRAAPGQARPARPRLQGRAAPRGVQGMGPAIATMPPPPPPQRVGSLTVVAPRQRRAASARARTAVALVCPAPPVSLNDASAADLTCLPGIGPVLAARIVTWRTSHGRFTEVKDLEQVPGVGAARVQRLVPYVRAP